MLASLLSAWPVLVARLAPTSTPSPAGPWAVESPWDLLRFALPLAAAVITALAVDRLAERRGELPPGFRDPGPPGVGPRPGIPLARLRRAGASALLAGFFWVGVFAAFGTLGREIEIDLSQAGAWTLFALHAVIAATLLAWGVLAFPPRRAAAPAVPNPDAVPDTRSGTGLGALARAFRLAEAQPGREIVVGLITGVAIWAAVLATVSALAVALTMAGREDWLPQGPPALVSFIAAQPFWVRLLGSLSAGFVEETFFRGFLQPRVGIGLSTGLFVLAHWSYGEPFMLVGVTLLSLIYAGLARWRGSVWAAATAHAVFDGVQLLVLIPLALKALPVAEEMPVVGLAVESLAALLW